MKRDREIKYKGGETLNIKDNILESCINGVAFTDLEGNLTYVNNSFLKMWGYNNSREVLGKRVNKFWQKEKRALTIIETVRKKGGWIGELMAVKKDGSTFDVQLSANMITNEDNKPSCIVNSFIVITDRKRAEKELHQSEEKYRSMYTSMNEGSALAEIIYDESGRAVDYVILDVNSSYELITGFKKEIVIGKKASEVYGTFNLLHLEIFAKVAASGQPTSFEDYIPQINKYMGISVFSPKRGQFATVFSDITQRKQMEKKLRESEEKYSTLIERARDGVVIVQDEVYQFVNRAAVKIIGYTTKELLGKSYLDILVPESRDSVAQRYNLCLAGKKVPICYETKIKCKDGTIKDTEVSIAFIQYNEKPGVMAIIRDNTRRKKMELELQKSHKLESIGTLAGGIAHDFNNLLTGIIGNLSLAKLYTKLGDQIFTLLTEAERASYRAKKLTQQFLVFSKGGNLIKKNISISKLLKRAIALSLSGSKAKCKFYMPDDLWWAEIDEGQMIQAVNNLVINAEQSMAGGGIIRISAENLDRTDDVMLLKDALLLKKGKFVKISIKDEGVGIPEEYLNKIFDPYFTTKQKGSGLGLAITYSIIKKHEGYIIAESTLGVGTAFYIYLPASKKEIFAVKEIKEEKLNFTKTKILFMDDQQIIRDMVKQMLIHLGGYEVEFAKDGVEAIELYEKAKKSGRTFDGIILDLTVPGGMGGKEAIKKLLQIDPGARAIVSSGYFNDPIMSDYKKYGFKGVVAKPYEIDELSETLQKVLTGVEEREVMESVF